MIGVLYTKTFQTALLSTLLFYVLANPDTFKMVKRIPGLKFVMKSTNEITHSGVITHALLFGVVLFLCVLLINKTLVQHFPFLNVVEHLTENERENINTQCKAVATAANYATFQAERAMSQCHEITDTDPRYSKWRGNTPLNDDGKSQNPDTVTPYPSEFKPWKRVSPGYWPAPLARKCGDAIPNTLQTAFCAGSKTGTQFKQDNKCDDYECGLTTENRNACCT